VSPVRSLIAAGSIACVTLVAGCGGGADLSSLPDVAKYTPVNSALLAEVDTSATNPGWGELREMLDSWDDLRTGLDALEGSAEARRIRPLLGGPMVIAGIQQQGKSAGGEIPMDLRKALAGSGQMQTVLALATGAEQAQARDAYVQSLGESDETVAGIKAWKQDGMMIAAPADAIVVASDRETLEAALRGAGPAPDLAEAVSGQDTADLVRGAVLPQAVAAGVPGVQLADEALRSGAYAFGMNATANGVTVDVQAPEDAPIEGGEFTPTLWKEMPAGTMAYVGFADLAGTVARLISQARTEGGNVSEVIDQVDALAPLALGVNWNDVIRLTSGEHALVAGGGSDKGWGALVLEVESPQEAQKTLDQVARSVVKNVAPQLSDQKLVVAAVTLGKVKVKGVKLEGGTWVTWGLRGERAVLAVGPAEGLAGFFAPADPPAALARAIGEAPDTVNSVVWMDAPGVARALGAGADYLPQIDKGLQSVLGFSAGRTGEWDLIRP